MCRENYSFYILVRSEVRLPQLCMYKYMIVEMCDDDI